MFDLDLTVLSEQCVRVVEKRKVSAEAWTASLPSRQQQLSTKDESAWRMEMNLDYPLRRLAFVKQWESDLEYSRS